MVRYGKDTNGTVLYFNGTVNSTFLNIITLYILFRIVMLRIQDNS